MFVTRTVLIILVVCAMSVARAEVSSFADVIPCDGTMSMTGAVENDVLYNQVFNWMHTRQVKKWTYKTTDVPEGLREKFGVSAETGLQCAEVSYMADLPLPNAFASFLGHMGLDTDVPIRVHKTVCASKSAIYEQAEVQEAVVSKVLLDSVHEMTEAGLKSSTEVRIELPWYAQIISRMIIAHIGVSVGEKNVAVRDSVCTVHAPALPRWNATYDVESVESVHMQMRRKKLPNVVGRRVPHLWRLQREFADLANVTGGAFGCRNCSEKTDEAVVEV